MATIEYFDSLLGESLEKLIEASDEIMEIHDFENRAILKKIGKIVSLLWNIREDIYEIRPDLKRDFVVEYEEDRERFESLNELNKSAIIAEKKGDFGNANKLYEDLLNRANFGYFRLIAEAGLYRCRCMKV